MKGGNLIEPTVHETGLPFDLKITKFPRQPKELVPLEEDLIKFAKNVRLQKVSYKFQRTLAKDMKEKQLSKKTFTATDRTSNIYSLSICVALQNAITSKYKKIDKHTAKNINKVGVKHARDARKSLLYNKDETGVKKEKVTLMLQWVHTMGLRYVN